jgi:hypothetical protein
MNYEIIFFRNLLVWKKNNFKDFRSCQLILFYTT